MTARALAEEEERLQIGIHHRVPIRFGEIDRVGAADDAGIVDEDVDAAEFGKHRIDERLHRADARQVGGEILGPAPEPAYPADGLVGGLTKLLANEWAAKGVQVNAIAPGYIATNNTAALQGDETRNRQIMERIPAGRWGDPSDIGGAAVFLASAAADYVQGHILAVDGGWLAR